MRYERVKKEHTYNVPVGAFWVTFHAVHAGDGEPNPDAIVDVDYEIHEVTVADTHLHDRELNEETCQVEYGDTHDFTDRLFATREMAVEHAKWTVNRFQRPQPWESFVKL